MKKATIFIVLILALLIGGLCYYNFFYKQSKHNSSSKTTTESDSYYSNVKVDSLNKVGLSAIENIVIKNNADVRRTQNMARYNSIYSLKLGTIVYTKGKDTSATAATVDQAILDKELKGDFVAVYSQKPKLTSDRPVGFMDVHHLVQRKDFKTYYENHKTIPFRSINSDMKMAIASNFNVDGSEFQFSTDAHRFNNSIVYGDFNNDGEKDFAVILDAADNSGSALLIFLKNTIDSDYTLAYKKAYSSMLHIKRIPKDKAVTVNGEATTFPIDGVLISGGGNSYFHIINSDTNTFMVLSN